MTTRRWARTTAVTGAVSVTVLAVLGGTGVVPTTSVAEESPGDVAVLTTGEQTPAPDVEVGPSAEVQPEQEATPEAEPGTGVAPEVTPDVTDEFPAPEASGSGRRVVFEASEQRVWLIGSAERVRRTYLVSGSTEDNLAPGRYTVLSRVPGIGEESGVRARLVVRFAPTPDGGALAFHTIPVVDGERVQRTRDLGTPRSAGSIRQATPDARELYDFARVGTPVVVLP